MNDGPPPPCAYCGATTAVTWSQVHGWSCQACAHQRTYQMLAEPVTALPVRDET